MSKKTAGARKAKSSKKAPEGAKPEAELASQQPVVEQAQPPKAKSAKAVREKHQNKPKRLSGLDAAAKVLEDSKKPMRSIDILGVIQEKGLWKTFGKTPEATLYAAMIREISKKGKDARFKKVERGLFAFAG